jgi:7,8-dihydro-6-hydroxymethylpterin-pyrophosphokinase
MIKLVDNKTIRNAVKFQEISDDSISESFQQRPLNHVDSKDFFNSYCRGSNEISVGAKDTEMRQRFQNKCLG